MAGLAALGADLVGGAGERRRGEREQDGDDGARAAPRTSGAVHGRGGRAGHGGRSIMRHALDPPRSSRRRSRSPAALATARAWKGINPGTTTQADVVEKFGEPTTKTKRTGRTVLAYYGEQALEGTRQAQFHVDPQGVVVEITIFLTAQLDAESIEGTYGKPPQRTFVEDTFQKVWLYPTPGRDGLLQQGGQRGGPDVRPRHQAGEGAARRDGGRRAGAARRGAVRVRVVGLTGGIASGKSTFAEALRARGVPVVDADALARAAVAAGSPALAEIARRVRAGRDRARRAPSTASGWRRSRSATRTRAGGSRPSPTPPCGAPWRRRPRASPRRGATSCSTTRPSSSRSAWTGRSTASSWSGRPAPCSARGSPRATGSPPGGRRRPPRGAAPDRREGRARRLRRREHRRRGELGRKADRLLADLRRGLGRKLPNAAPVRY